MREVICDRCGNKFEVGKKVSVSRAKFCPHCRPVINVERAREFYRQKRIREINSVVINEDTRRRGLDKVAAAVVGRAYADGYKVIAGEYVPEHVRQAARVWLIEIGLDWIDTLGIEVELPEEVLHG